MTIKCKKVRKLSETFSENWLVLLLLRDHCLFPKRIFYLCHNCCWRSCRRRRRLLLSSPLKCIQYMLLVPIAWKCVWIVWIRMYDESRLVRHAYVIASSSQPPPPPSNAKCKLKCSITSSINWKHTFVWHGKMCMEISTCAYNTARCVLVNSYARFAHLFYCLPDCVGGSDGGPSLTSKWHWPRQKNAQINRWSFFENENQNENEISNRCNTNNIAAQFYNKLSRWLIILNSHFSPRCLFRFCMSLTSFRKNIVAYNFVSLASFDSCTRFLGT